MIPLSKDDIASAKKLSCATDNEILRALPELFEWLQDCNWPVFPAVCDRVSKLKIGLDEQVKRVLLGDDIIWKCCIVGHLFPKLELSKVKSYEPLLRSLITNASLDDYKEGLVDYVEIQLARIKEST